MDGKGFVGKRVGIEVSPSARRSESEADLLRESQFSRKSRPCKVPDRLSVPNTERSSGSSRGRCAPVSARFEKLAAPATFNFALSCGGASARIKSVKRSMSAGPSGPVGSSTPVSSLGRGDQKMAPIRQQAIECLRQDRTTLDFIW